MRNSQTELLNNPWHARMGSKRLSIAEMCCKIIISRSLGRQLNAEVLLLQAPLQLSTSQCRSVVCCARTDWEEELWQMCSTSVRGQVCCISCQPDIDETHLFGPFTRIAYLMPPAGAGFAFLPGCKLLA